MCGYNIDIELRSHLIDFAVAAAAVAAVVASHFVFLILRPFDFLLATFFFLCFFRRFSSDVWLLKCLSNLQTRVILFAFFVCLYVDTKCITSIVVLCSFGMSWMMHVGTTCTLNAHTWLQTQP